MKKISIVALLALSTSACLLPEKFEASIRFAPDGAYTYKFEGTAVHVLAAAAIKQNGSLSAKDENGLKQDAEKGAKLSGVKKMSYVGNGRYEMRIEEDIKSGQQVKSLKFFAVSRDQSGIYTLAVPVMKDKDLEQLRSLDVKVNGRADIMLPSNAKVLDHNASDTPGLFSKAYSWKIGALDAQPKIRFTLSN